MKFINTKKLENSNGNSAVTNTKENSSQTAKSNLDKRFEALGKASGKSYKSFDGNNRKIATAFAIDSSNLDKLNDYCKKHYSSRSAIVNRIIAEWLENLKD